MITFLFLLSHSKLNKMEKDLTLPQALGLEQNWYDALAKKVEETYGNGTDKISDCMEQMMTDLKDDEFGETTSNMSKYERKLVLLGYLIGLQRANGDGDPLRMFLEAIIRTHTKGD